MQKGAHMNVNPPQGGYYPQMLLNVSVGDGMAALVMCFPLQLLRWDQRQRKRIGRARVK